MKNRNKTIPIICAAIFAICVGTTTWADNPSKLWAWGSEQYGALGNGSSAGFSIIPLEVDFQGKKPKDIAVSSSAAFATMQDGSLYAWGWGYRGQLGNGSTTSSYTPIEIFDSGVYDVIIGNNNNTYAIKEGGELWAWGDNSYGLLGNGTWFEHFTLYRVFSSGVGFVVTGDKCVFAVKTDGSVWAWGYNTHGQLGDGTTNGRYSPVQIFSSGVKSLATGTNTTYALKTDGSVWAWGTNTHGQIGNGTTTEQRNPVQIFDSGVISIAAASSTAYAIKTDGSLWAWGYNTHGQIGNGTRSDCLSPVQVHGMLSEVSSVVTGSVCAYAIKEDGSLWAWGNAVFGIEVEDISIPNMVLDRDVKSISYDISTLFVNKNDGSLWVCGSNICGKLGIGSTGNVSSLTMVNLNNVDKALASLRNGFAITKTYFLTNITTSSTLMSISLNWNVSQSLPDFDHYEIYRGEQLATNGGNVTAATFTENGLAANTTYDYTIKAIDTNGEVITSVTTTISTQDYNALASLTASNIKTTELKLNWNAVAGVTVDGYIIKRNTDTIRDIGNLCLDTEFIDTGLTPDTEYTYTVIAVISGGGQSNPASTTPAIVKTSAIGAVQNLRLYAQWGHRIKLMWDAPEDASNVAKYIVYRKSGETLSKLLETTGTTCVIGGLTAGNSYTHVVVPVDSEDNEFPGAEIANTLFGASPKAILFEFNDEGWNKSTNTAIDTGSDSPNNATITGGNALFTYNGAGGTALKLGLLDTSSNPDSPLVTQDVILATQVSFARQFALETRIFKGNEEAGDITIIDANRTQAQAYPMTWKVTQDGKMSVKLPTSTDITVQSQDAVFSENTWTSLQVVVNLDNSSIEQAVKLYKNGTAIPTVVNSASPIDDWAVTANSMDIPLSLMSVKLLKKSENFTLKSDFVRIKFQEDFATNNPEDFHDGEVQTGIDENSSASIQIDPANMLKRVINPPGDFEGGAKKANVTIAYDNHPAEKSVFHGIFQLEFGLETTDFDGILYVDIYIRKPGDIPNPDTGGGFKKIGEKEINCTGDNKPAAGSGAWMHQYYWNSRAKNYDWQDLDIGAYRTNDPVQFKFVVR